MTAAWQTVRVFISSTFRDMQAERDHLVRFVFPRLREELLQRRIHLVDVDLRWGVTSEQDSLQVCKEIIDECRPRFLCMLGGRYGWTPPGREESITAAEVRYGVLDRLGAHGYAFFYFRDPAATSSMVETRPGEFREPPGSPKERKLTELKSTITKAGLNPFVYPATWDSEACRLTGLKAFGDQVYADLKRSIDEELGEQPPQKLDEFAEENVAMEAFVEERTERFVLGSRESVLKELLTHAGETGGNGYICLSGAAGSGKSALLAYLYRRLQSPVSGPPPSLVIAHFVGASPGSTDVRRTLRRLCHELKTGSPGITAEIPEDPEKLGVAFPDFLRQACEKKRVVIVLDAVNQFDPASHSAGLHWLPEDLPANARIILSMLDGPALEELRRRYRPPREIELQPLTASDGEAIIEQFSQRYRKELESGQRATLLAKTGADTPLYLLAAMEELRTLGTYEEITSRIAQLPPDTQALFTWILRRLEDDDGFRDAVGRKIGQELVPRFASLMGVSRYGLSQGELVDLLGAGDPQGNVAALLHLLRPYLMRRGELLDFYHGQFRAAAEEAWLKTNTQRQAAHTQLALHFLAQNNCNLHKLSALPYHLIQSNMWDELETVLKDLLFLESKCAAGLARELLTDFHNAADTLNRASADAANIFRQVYLALRAHINNMDLCPDSFLSIAYIAFYDALETPKSSVRELLYSWVRQKTGPWLRPTYVPARPDSQFLEARMFVGSGSGVESLQFATEENLLMAIDSSGTRTVWSLADLRQVMVLGSGSREMESRITDHGRLVLFDRCNTQIQRSHVDLRAPWRVDHQSSSYRIEILGRTSEIAPWRWLTIIDKSSGRSMACWRPHGSVITDVIFLDNPMRFVTASADGEVAIWNLSALAKNGTHRESAGAVVAGHGNKVEGIDVATDGDFGISIGLGGDCIVWDISGRCVSCHIRLYEMYKGHPQFVRWMGRSRIALVVSNVGNQQRLCMVDAETGKGHHLRVVSKPSWAISEQGQDRFRVVAHAKSSGLLLWKTHKPPYKIASAVVSADIARDPIEVDPEPYHFDNFDSLIPRSREEDILSLSHYGLIVLGIDPIWGTCSLKSTGDVSWKRRDLWSTSSLHLQWRFTKLEMPGRTEYLLVEGFPSKRVAWALDASTIIVGDTAGTVVFLSLAGPEPVVQTVLGHKGEVVACAIRADGRFAVTIGADMRLTLWDCRRAQPVTSFPLDFTPSCCSMSADGCVIAVGMHGGQVLFLSPEGILPCDVPDDTEFRKREEALLTRLRIRSVEGIRALRDFDLLVRLTSASDSSSRLRRAAVERIIELVSWHLFEAGAMCYATGFVCDTARSHPDPSVRVRAVKALSDPAVLDEFARSVDHEVAEAARNKIAQLDATSWFIVQQDMTIRECCELAEVLGNSCKHEVQVRAEASEDLRDGKSIFGLICLAAAAGTRIGFIFDPHDIPVCITAINSINWLRPCH